MRFIIITFLSFCLAIEVNAQSSVGDSVHYYRTQLGKYYHRVWDSVRQLDTARMYTERIMQAKDHSKSYTAFMLFGQSAGADFSTFNAAIARDGFGPLNGPIWGLGLGVSHKAYNGIMIDFNYAVFGFNRGSSNGEEKISANYSNFLGLELGYAVVNASRFTIYPYGGLSLRLGGLSYSAPTTTNTGYNSIASLVRNNQSASGSNTHLSYQAGLGIDCVIGYNEKKHAGTMIFGKFGTDGIFGNESYKISGVEYNSGIKYGMWMAQFGFKFFGR
jgi:hypothetical protein